MLVMRIQSEGAHFLKCRSPPPGRLMVTSADPVEGSIIRYPVVAQVSAGSPWKK